jgi:hypothetical protein
LVLSLLLVLPGCRRHAGANGDPATDTIAPATPPAAGDSDTALTQTVEIGDERSPNEGSVLTDSSTPEGTSLTPAPKAAASRPPAGAPKKRSSE